MKFGGFIIKNSKNIILALPIILMMIQSSAYSQVYSQSGGTAALTNQSYSSVTADESAVKVTNSGVFTLTNSTITKSGTTSSDDNSSFYGQNAGILATTASTINLEDCTVNTTGRGANGVFAYGAGTTVNMKRLTITCTEQGGHAIMATGGGVMAAEDVDMTTSGTNSGAIATDRGSGTITVTGGTVITTGQDSPGIYSTGLITVSDATISASGSESAVIEGANSIVLNNTSITSSKANKWGVLIYQSMSGDAEGTDGTFTMTGGSLSNTAATGPLFYVTNSTGIITLNNAEISTASDTLIQAGSNKWGTSGKNGGHIVLSANEETISGSIVMDSYSSFSGTLNSTTYTGAINNSNTASSASLTMDGNSTWTLTGNSYLDVFSDVDGISGTSVANVNGNGYNVYYDASLSGNSSLGGLTYSLVNGGYLLPEGSTSVGEAESSVITDYALAQNYPNPFNPTTNISFSLPRNGFVTLKIYNSIGEEVATLVNNQLDAGKYSYTWNAAALASGVYIYRVIVTGNNGGKQAFSQAKKLILSK